MEVITIECVYCKKKLLSAPVSTLLDDHGVKFEHDCHARHTAPVVTGPSFRVQVLTEKEGEKRE